MNLRFWYKSCVQLCIGIAIGCVIAVIWTGKWALLPGWATALFWAIGWRIEIATSENLEKDSNYWKNMWVNGRQMDLDEGFGHIESRSSYVTQEELDARKKRIMEFDFTESKDKKENA